MLLSLYHVDAFTDHLFGGNPAAVVPLEEWLPDSLLLSIAAENNLSETAFFLNRDPQDPIPLRWFSPSQEVPLCGHATLAAAHVILTQLHPTLEQVTFDTLSGLLRVRRSPPASFAMDLPRFSICPCDLPPDLLAALPTPPQETFTSHNNFYAVYDRAATIRTYQPSRPLLHNLVITAPGDPESQSDIVCRYFAPQFGIPEDPVTGSIQCALTPYWAARLQKAQLTCRQLSRRQGYLQTTLHPDHIEIQAQAVLYLSGSLTL